MSDPELPTFVGQIAGWLENEDNNEVIQQLRKDACIRELQVQQYKVKKDLELQERLRPELRKIPGFWPFALTRNVGFARVCTSADDNDALSYLSDLELKVDPEDPRAFELVFTFNENPYFSNATLTKSFVLAEENAAGSSSKAKANGNITDDMLNFDPEEDLKPLKTNIDWKSSEKNLCEKHPRSFLEGDEDFEGDPGSFFWWFGDEVDHFQLGPLLSNSIIPNCIDHFLGIADGCQSDDEDDDSEDEEDEEDEDEIDLEDDERPKKRSKRD